MSWQNGKRNRTGSAIRNGAEDRQITNALRVANVPATPENREKAQQAIGGIKRTNKEVVDLVKALFANESEPSA